MFTLWVRLNSRCVRILLCFYFVRAGAGTDWRKGRLSVSRVPGLRIDVWYPLCTLHNITNVHEFHCTAVRGVGKRWFITVIIIYQSSLPIIIVNVSFVSVNSYSVLCIAVPCAHEVCASRSLLQSCEKSSISNTEIRRDIRLSLHNVTRP